MTPPPWAHSQPPRRRNLLPLAIGGGVLLVAVVVIGVVVGTSGGDSIPAEFRTPLGCDVRDRGNDKYCSERQGILRACDYELKPGQEPNQQVRTADGAVESKYSDIYANWGAIIRYQGDQMTFIAEDCRVTISRASWSPLLYPGPESLLPPELR